MTSFLVGSTPDVLDAVSGSAANVGVWQRALPDFVETTLTDHCRTLRQFDATLSSRDLHQVVAEVPTGPARDWLQADLSQLFERLVHLSQQRRLRVVFGPVSHDKCRKFHVDYLRLRIVTTYLGPGTQWLADADVQREVLSDPPECPQAANRSILKPQAQVHTAAAGDVVLLKGVAFGAQQLAAVHRSPPIEHLGLTRVVLALSTVEQPT